MSNEIEPKPCRVCSTPNTSLHFGIEACRACAAFFKRATLLEKKYPCRAGNRQCDVTRDGQLACRGCRFDKCTAVGMVYAGPLRKHFPAKKKVVDCEAAHADPNVPSTSAGSLLDRIGVEYEKSYRLREGKELEFLRQCASDERVPNFVQEVYTGTVDLIFSIVNLIIDQMWPFFRAVFPTLSELPMNEQAELYRSHLPHFILIDSYFRTWQIWGGYDKYIMCSASTCIDLDAPHEWLRGDVHYDKRTAMQDVAESHVREQVATLAPVFERASVVDKEAYALLALSLCDTDLRADAVSEAMHMALDAIRDEVLRELQLYYKREMGLDDCSARIGNLMSICHALRECSSHFQEFFRAQVTLFDMNTAETQLTEMFL